MKTYLDKKKTARLARCSRILRILILLTMVNTCLTNSSLLTLVPALEFPARILAFVVDLAYGIVLLCMTFSSDGFKYAAYCRFFIISLTPAVLLLKVLEGSSWVQDLAAFLSAVLSCFSLYQEFRGHEEAIMSADAEISERWSLLWKLVFYTYLVTIPSTLITMYFPLIGAILLLICMIILIVLKVKQYTLLEDTAKAYDAWEPPVITDNDRHYRYF